MRTLASDYMRWAKLEAGARFNLASSGMASLPWADLGATVDDLELTGPSGYGYAPLREAIGARYHVPAGSVFAAAGTSFANHMALAGLLEAGDEILVEHPTYELLLSTASYVGARIHRFPRPAIDGFQIDRERFAELLTPRIRLVVLTNPHNPSGAVVAQDTLRQIGEMAARVGARVLVDEVYLDALSDPPPPSAVHLGGAFLTTNSLTKVYGLSGLRCGWVLADPDLTERFWRLNDLFGVNAPHVAERLSLVALRHLDRLGARARAQLARNRAVLQEFLARRKDLECTVQPPGMMAFPRWIEGDVGEWCRRLRHELDTTVVPGRFFEMPDHFRIGIGGDPETVAGGLERLGMMLDRLWARDDGR